MVTINYELKKERDEPWKFRIKLDVNFDDNEKYVDFEILDDEQGRRMLIKRHVDEKNEVIWSPSFYNTYNNKWKAILETKNEEKATIATETIELDLERPAKVMSRKEEKDMLEEAEQSIEQEVEQQEEPEFENENDTSED